MSPAVLDHMTSEARLAFIRYCDENAGSGKTASQIWCDAYVLGHQAGLSPRSIIAIEADAASLLASEFGVSPCALPMN